MTQRAKPIALFDLDNTLADFNYAMKTELEVLQGHDEPVRDGHRPDWQRARERLIKVKPGFWRNLKPYEPGFRILKIATDLGYRPYILSRGPKNNAAAWAEKVGWCYEHVPGLPIILAERKDLVYGRVLVDDWPQYYMPWLKHRPRGLVIAPLHPWNTYEPAHDRVLRYNGANDDEVRAQLTKAMAQP